MAFMSSLWKGSVNGRPAELCQTSLSCHSFHRCGRAFFFLWTEWAERGFSYCCRTESILSLGLIVSVMYLLSRGEGTVSGLEAQVLKMPVRYKYSLRSHLAASTSPTLIPKISYPAKLLQGQTETHTRHRYNKYSSERDTRCIKGKFFLTHNIKTDIIVYMFCSIRVVKW